MSPSASRRQTRVVSLACAAVLLTATFAGAQVIVAEDTDRSQLRTEEVVVVVARSPELSVTVPRPAALPPLYIAYATLQGLDAASTFRVLDRGGVERNPLLSGVAGSRGPMLALKAGTVAATIVLTERLRKRHPLAAVVLMSALNSAHAAVVVHNYHVASRAGR